MAIGQEQKREGRNRARYDRHGEHVIPASMASFGCVAEVARDSS